MPSLQRHYSVARPVVDTLPDGGGMLANHLQATKRSLLPATSLNTMPSVCST